jgi:sporulation protein YlmC with PRC-barrel domain
VRWSSKEERMKRKNWVIAAGATILVLGLANSLTALDAPGTSGQFAWPTQGPSNPGADREGRFSRAEDDALTFRGGTTVRERHKASNLLDMHVRNHWREPLGQVRDLVVDLQTGLVAYVVIAREGVEGDRNLIAVPFSALLLAPEPDTLMLEAEKRRFKLAEGFREGDWPPLRRNTSDANRPNRLENAGSLGASERREPGNGFTPRRGDPPILPDQPNQLFEGRIISVHPENRTVTVAGDITTEMFQVDRAATIQVRDLPGSDLSELQAGDEVLLLYRPAPDGLGIVSSIRKQEGAPPTRRF